MPSFVGLTVAGVRALLAVALVPVQEPLAVQDVALVEDQESVALSPSFIVAGLMMKLSVGGEDQF